MWTVRQTPWTQARVVVLPGARYGRCPHRTAVRMTAGSDVRGVSPPLPVDRVEPNRRTIYRAGMTTKRHPDPAVRAVLKEAMHAGWRFEPAPGGRAHIFGRLLCPGGICQPVWVLSTPRGDAQSKILRRNMARCPHKDTLRDEGS